MHEPQPLPRHGIFVAATEIEGLGGERGREGRLDRHESMIAVDHHPRSLGARKAGQRRQVGGHPPASEQDLADENQVVIAACRSREEARAEIVERLGGNALDGDAALFLPPRQLTPRAVEFAVAGQDSERFAVPTRAGRCQSNDEIVRIRGEDDRRRVAGAKLSRDLRLRLGPHLAHHPVPFGVGEPRGIVPAFDLPVAAGVGPQMMAVRGKVQPPRRGAEAAREQPLGAHNSVRSDHSTGKARFDSVAAR